MLRLSLIFLLAACLRTLPAAAQDSPAHPLRIGTYDSRAVALAWGRSPERGDELRGLMAEHQRAKGKAKRRELERKGEELQIRLHQRVFSTVGAGDLLAGKREELAALATAAGVVALVSRWEIPWQAPGVELVDLSEQVAGLFGPDEATLKQVRELLAQPPLPFQELPLDARF